MNIETLFHEEISDEFEKLRQMEVGSDQYKTTVDGITKLTDRAIEMMKNDEERKDRLEAQRLEQESKQTQLKEDRINRIVNIAIESAKIVIPVALAVWGTHKSFQFEKEGTITTIMGRGFINKLLPKK